MRRSKIAMVFETIALNITLCGRFADNTVINFRQRYVLGQDTGESEIMIYIPAQWKSTTNTTIYYAVFMFRFARLFLGSGTLLR